MRVLLIGSILVGWSLTGSASAFAAKRIVVDLDNQMLSAYEGEERVYEFHAVTGTCAKWTHPGLYTIDRKNRRLCQQGIRQTDAIQHVFHRGR
jgi:hypothetical protein